MPDNGQRIAYVSAFVCGMGLAMTAFLSITRHQGIDPLQMTGPEAISRLGRGASLLLFGSTTAALIIGMVLGSRIGPSLFGYGRWDRIDELSALQLRRIHKEGLDVACSACTNMFFLVVPEPDVPWRWVIAHCDNCGSVIRARVSGDLLVMGAFGKKALVQRAHREQTRR